MTLHPNISLYELTEYCRLCHEYGNAARRVKFDKPTLQRIRQVGNVVTPNTRFFGVQFLARHTPEK